MKNPREVLLARHRNAEPALDAVRRESIKAMTDQQTERRPAKTLTTGAWRMFCRELFLPSRHIWAGLAACWVLILVLHFAGHERAAVVQKSPPPTSEMLAALRPQQQLLVELLSGDTSPRNLERPPRPISSPHSEIRRPSAFA